MFHQRDGRHEGRGRGRGRGFLHDRREQFEERLQDRREAVEERRCGHGHHREHSEERRYERYEDHRRDPDQSQYAAPPGGLSRADFVSDEEFNRMMHNGGGFERPRMGGDIGPEDFSEWDRQRPPQNAGYQAPYSQQSELSGLRSSDAPLPPIPYEQRTSGYEGSAYAQPSHNQYSVSESLEPHRGSNVYLPPAGAPGAPFSHAPAGGYASPPGPPPPARPSYGYDAPPQGGSGRGAASDYYNGPSPGQSAQSYSHTPDNATTYGEAPNPPPYHSHEFDEENYRSHLSAHAQAYGSGNDDRPMAYDAIGAAAAVEALKITAANNQSGNGPQQGGRPQGGFHSDADAPLTRPSAGVSSGAQHSSDMGGRPSGGRPQGRPQNAESESESEDEDNAPAAKAQAPTGGGGMQDKIVALAMAQAGKLFDKKGGGDKQGKSQAMQTAAATAMRLMGEYKSTGKVNMEPGEMQKLMGVAMSLF